MARDHDEDFTDYVTARRAHLKRTAYLIDGSSVYAYTMAAAPKLEEPAYENVPTTAPLPTKQQLFAIVKDSRLRWSANFGK